MSECRSLTNFIGNAVATLVVARWDDALDRDAMARALGKLPAPLSVAPDPAAGPGDPRHLTTD
jgi:aerobic C4-dicarboxylate transport protein